MPTTAYAITITPPEISGFYAPVEVRFEDAVSPRCNTTVSDVWGLSVGTLRIASRRTRGIFQ